MRRGLFVARFVSRSVRLSAQMLLGLGSERKHCDMNKLSGLALESAEPGMGTPDKD